MADKSLTFDEFYNKISGGKYKGTTTAGKNGALPTDVALLKKELDAAGGPYGSEDNKWFTKFKGNPSLPNWVDFTTECMNVMQQARKQTGQEVADAEKAVKDAESKDQAAKDAAAKQQKEATDKAKAVEGMQERLHNSNDGVLSYMEKARQQDRVRFMNAEFEKALKAKYTKLPSNWKIDTTQRTWQGLTWDEIDTKNSAANALKQLGLTKKADTDALEKFVEDFVKDYDKPRTGLTGQAKKDEAVRYKHEKAYAAAQGLSAKVKSIC